MIEQGDNNASLIRSLPWRDRLAILAVIGVVISHVDGELSDADAANLAALRSELADRLRGEIRALDATDQIPAGALDLDAIVEALRAEGAQLELL